MIKKLSKKRSLKSKKQVKQKNIGLKLNALKFALTGGILTGLFVACVTLCSLLEYFELIGILIYSVYGVLGYSITAWGILIGAIYGFIDGFIMFGIFAWLYNKLL